MKSKEKKVNNVEQSKDISKKKKILKYVLNGAVWGVILGFLIYSGLKVIDVKTGYKLLSNHSAVIVSGSMSYVNEENYSYLDKDVEHIQKGDVVHTSEYDSFEEVEKLNVVLYLTEDGTLICHRVIDKYVDNGIQYVVTRGDANNADDAPVKYDLLVGKVTSVTGGGGAVLFFQSPYFVLALCGTGFFILLGYLVFNLKTEKKAAGVSISSEEEKPVEESPVEEHPTEEAPVEDQPTEEDNVENQQAVEDEPEENKEEVVAEQPMVEEPIKEEKPKGKFIPKGGKQKKINWPPKNTKWTKENNPTTNKKRADGGNK